MKWTIGGNLGAGMDGVVSWVGVGEGNCVELFTFHEGVMAFQSQFTRSLKVGA